MNAAALQRHKLEGFCAENGNHRSVLPKKGSNWEANLELSFQQRARGCRLTECRHHGPLYVQKPFYPEGPDLAHVYLLHPPGGLVSGDRLQISMQLEKGTRVLVTTPGAGRIYRARADKRLQQQINTIELHEGGSIEWLPQETIVYPGASGRMDTRVSLGKNSQFSGWEITCLGLPASGLVFNTGELQQRLMISREGKPLLIENLLINDESRKLYTAVVGMQSCPVTGIFVAGSFLNEVGNGKVNEEMQTAILAELRGAIAQKDLSGLAGVTAINGFIVARYLGSCSEEARSLFIKFWTIMRPMLIQRPACIPRIWST